MINIKKIIPPIFISIIAGAGLFHYENLFPEAQNIYYTHADDRIVILGERSFHSLIISVHNFSGEKINNIFIKGQFKSDIKDSSFRIIDKNGSPVSYTPSINEEKFSVEISELISNNIVIYNLVFETSKPSRARYSVGFDQALIQLSSRFSLGHEPYRYIYNTAYFLFLLSYICIILAFYLRWRSGIFPGFFKSNSEAGFALLHSGEIKEAKNYIENMICKQRGYTAYDLSNLAVCYALEDNIEKARNYISSAKMLSVNPDIKIIKLAEAITDYCDNSFNSGGSNIKKIKLPEKIFSKSKIIEKMLDDDIS